MLDMVGIEHVVGKRTRGFTMGRVTGDPITAEMVEHIVDDIPASCAHATRLW